MAHSSVKLHSIYRQLKNDILTGKWSEGDTLPNEDKLAELFQCSKGTISKSVSLLVHDELVERRPRTGTRVIRGTITQAPQGILLDAYLFLYPTRLHEGTRRMADGFQAAAYDSKRRVIMMTTGLDYEKEVEILKQLKDMNVRGCVTCPVISNAMEEIQFTQLLKASTVPVVLAGRVMPGSPAVSLDGFDAGYQTTRYLIKQGLRKIGFLHQSAGSMLERDKLNGYRSALNEAGIELNFDYVPTSLASTPNVESPIREPMEAAMRFLSTHLDLEGVVCLHDFMAAGAINAALKLGKKVPDNFKVIGIDGFQIAADNGLTLTSYKVPYEEIGRRAFTMLEESLSGNASTVPEIQLKGEIVAGQSA